MNIRGTNINYIQYGKKNGNNIVLLHGWGQNIEMMEPIGQKLKDDFFITNIDLPGFGKSEDPKVTTIYEYIEILKELFKKLNIQDPILIGHSFGGKLSLLYAADNKVKKLILLASPFKKSDKKPSLKLKFLKTMAKVPFLKTLANKMKSKMGSDDYKNANETMKKVMVNHVNEDATSCLSQIKCPTLLIWGDKDTAVPLSHAKEAEELIPNAGLIIYENKTHYAYLEDLNRTIIILKEFLSKDVK